MHGEAMRRTVCVPTHGGLLDDENVQRVWKVGSNVKYPALFCDLYGAQAAIFRGHNVPLDQLQRGARDVVGGHGLSCEEVWLDERRVKWCSRYDWPCDSDGEWHTHWFEMQSGSAGYEFTLVRSLRDE